MVIFEWGCCWVSHAYHQIERCKLTWQQEQLDAEQCRSPGSDIWEASPWSTQSNVSSHNPKTDFQLTFCRNGILFDVVQCLIQRNLTYATRDVRTCYAIIKSTLYQPHLTKVVFILHSQGGIEGGMILDWLLQEVPQDLLAKLEVYTFGNAANHFNNPHLHLLSQTAAVQNPDKPSTTKTFTQINYHEPSAPSLVDISTTAPTMAHRRTKSKSTRQESTSGKTIRYIEHYAHTQDFVAQWGVLHFVPASASSAAVISNSAPRFMGRVFERQGMGHQMNQHYLDSMFPLKRSLDPKGGIAGTGFEGVDVDGDFMSSILDLTPNSSLQAEEEEVREGVELSYQSARGESLEESENKEVLLRDFSPSSTFHALAGKFSSKTTGISDGKGLRRGESLVNGDGVNGDGVNGDGVKDDRAFRVRDLSRLWLYVNGGSPVVDETDVSIARMSTI